MAHDLVEWVLTGGGAWFNRADVANPKGFSGAALTNALKSLADQGVLEHRGEKRGRGYRLATAYLKQVYCGNLLDEPAWQTH